MWFRGELADSLSCLARIIVALRLRALADSGVLQAFMKALYAHWFGESADGQRDIDGDPWDTAAPVMGIVDPQIVQHMVSRSPTWFVMV